MKFAVLPSGHPEALEALEALEAATLLRKLSNSRARRGGCARRPRWRRLRPRPDASGPRTERLRKLPIFGMNFGTIGFLMNGYDVDRLPERVAEAEPLEVPPLLMSAEISDGSLVQGFAFNDVYLHWATREMAHLEVSVDGSSQLASLRADGDRGERCRKHGLQPLGGRAYSAARNRCVGADADLSLPTPLLERSRSSRPHQLELSGPRPAASARERGRRYVRASSDAAGRCLAATGGPRDSSIRPRRKPSAANAARAVHVARSHVSRRQHGGHAEAEDRARRHPAADAGGGSLGTRWRR